MSPVESLPPDDWPGVPGASWGMGSRVRAGGLVGRVVAAEAFDDEERWIVYVKAHPDVPPIPFRPSEIELDE